MSSNNVDDRLSMMPEEIVSYILSSMPTKFAVRTSILSKRWRYRWMFVTNLDFDDTHPFHGKKTFSKFVNRVMKSCKSSQVRLFRLHFSRRWDQNPCVLYWIYRAVMLNVCELDIHADIIKLPPSLFNCKTLTKLILHSSARDWSISHTAWRFPCHVNLPCLITLDVVVTFTPFDYVYKLILGCPMLENLSLEVSSRNEKQDYIFNIPTLKRLKLAWRKFASANRKVVLHVPNLEYLFVCNACGPLFVMEDMPSMVEATVSFDSRIADNIRVQFLKRMCRLESLSIQNFLSASTLPIFLNMKHLELKSFRDRELITQFIESSPELKQLCIKQPSGSHWTEPKLVPACMPTNLTTIKFSNYKFNTCDIQLLEYILGNAKVLKTLTITLENLTIGKEMWLCARLFKFPKASRFCEIHFRGNWSHSS